MRKDFGTFCGETEEPIKIEAGAEIIFWVSPITAFAAAPGRAPGFGTSGTLDVVFSSAP